MAKEMSFVSAMRDYFGLKQDQTAQGFMLEMRALSAEDRAWFRENLPKVGYEIKDTLPAT